MVPLDSVLHGNTLPPTFHSFSLPRPASQGLVAHCQAIPGLVRMNGHPPSSPCLCSTTQWCTAGGLTDKRHMSKQDMARPPVSRLDLKQPWSL